MMKRTIPVLFVAALALGLTACSDDDGEKSDVKFCKGVCEKNDDCPQGLFCKTGTGKCVMCTQDSDCNTAVYKGGCDTTTNMCKMCSEDSHCPAPTYTGCEKTTGYCKMCTTDADCTKSGITILSGKCHPTYFMCMKCDSDADCTYTGAVGKYCGSKNICAQCAKDEHCPAGKGCDTTTNMCVDKCKADADCAPLKCNVAKGVCECTTDQECTDKYGSASKLKWTCTDQL
jgi:hypothetical protein